MAADNGAGDRGIDDAKGRVKRESDDAKAARKAEGEAMKGVAKRGLRDAHDDEMKERLRK